jgi:hypothetical protein
MQKSKIVMTLATSIVVVLALASFNPTAYSQPTSNQDSINPTGTPKHITLILPSGSSMDFQATPDQLQAILMRVINSIVGQTAAPGADQTAIKENVAVSLNATWAASNVLAAAHIKEAPGFQKPGACVETFGVIWCIM